jgi:hypothetical protein
MRQLAPCVVLLFLAACPGTPDFGPFDGGDFGVLVDGGGGTGGSSSSGGSSSGGSSSGGPVAACGEGIDAGTSCLLPPPPPSDGGAPDAGADAGLDAGEGADAGEMDAGHGSDAGEMDAGHGSDAGAVDAGQEPDSGVADAGSAIGICCSNGCVDPQTDPVNCGGCGIACPSGATCHGGGCVGADGGAVTCAQTGCEPGFTCLDAGCLSQSCTAADQGNPCAYGTVQGLCCGGACVDPFTQQNCGSCGTQCSSADFCDGAKGCQPNPPCGPTNTGTNCAIDAGLNGVCCPTGCAALASDPNNCGFCGAVCPAGALCAAGACVMADAGPASCQTGGCPPGTGCAGSYCLETSCAAGYASCLFGVDVEGNPKTGSCCSGACVDTSQNPADCGSCGTSCSTEVCAPGPVCLPPPLVDGGACTVTCAAGQSCTGAVCVDKTCDKLSDLCVSDDAGDIGVCCPNSLGYGVCASIATDPQNCGGCGLTCPPSQGCRNGTCTGSGGACGPGTTGMYCNFDAGPSYLCCPGRPCTDVRSDILNCGACSNICPTGTYCIDGNCQTTSCGPGVDSGIACQLPDSGVGGCCGRSCLDVLHDPNNCMSCGNVCTPPSGSCDFGVCGVASCSDAFPGAPCARDNGPGFCCGTVCTDLSRDPQNCGNCNVACAGDAGCFQGNCQ